MNIMSIIINQYVYKEYDVGLRRSKMIESEDTTQNIVESITKGEKQSEDHSDVTRRALGAGRIKCLSTKSQCRYGLMDCNYSWSVMRLIMTHTHALRNANQKYVRHSRLFSLLSQIQLIMLLLLLGTRWIDILSEIIVQTLSWWQRYLTRK